MLEKFNLLDRVIFSSFNHCSTMFVKQINKTLPCGLLVESKGLENAGFYANKLGMEYFHPDISTLTKEQVIDCKNHGINLNVWTVNDLKDLRKCIEFKSRWNNK